MKWGSAGKWEKCRLSQDCAECGEVLSTGTSGGFHMGKASMK